MDTRPIPTTFKLLSAILFSILVIALWSAHPAEWDTSSASILGISLFLLLGVLTEAFPLNFAMGRASFGFSGTIYWAFLLAHGPFWAASGWVLGQMFSDIAVRRKNFFKALYNSTQLSLSLLAAGLVLGLLSGDAQLSADPRFFITYLVAIIVNWLLNTALVSVGVSILYGGSARRFWRKNFQWVWVYELTSAPIALVVAFAYLRLGVVGLAMVALPALMIRLAYSQYLSLKRTYHETVRTLIKVIEMHDPYTAGHSDRVANYARRLCEALNLSPANTEKIELAAYLHDLGKIHLDLTGIVRKAGKLTEDERRMVRLHPVMSADLANQVSYFQGEIEAMIRHHHENWDGSGYPHGLQGENIPLGSRVILLADSFDAMTTSRVYREALDIEFVKNEFIKFSGIQFDPDLVPVFLDKVVRNGEGIISKPIDEPMEGLRARAPEVAAKRPTVRTLPRRDAI